MQTEMMNAVDTFAKFQKDFDHFFGPCETGFKNELIIQMLTRIYEPDTKVIDYGKKFREMYFIRSGNSVMMYDKLM